jgi:uncharacterized membrane protein
MPLFGQMSGSSDSAPAWTSHLVQTIGALHPLVIHFPIALLLTAAFLELISVWIKDHPGLRFAIAVNLLLGTLGALVAATLGWMDAAHIGLEPDLKPVLAWHRWLGTSVAVGSLITAALWFRFTRTNKVGGLGIYRIALWLLAIVLGITGHLGGLLVYGLDSFSPS